jgi:ribosome-binding factor A
MGKKKYGRTRGPLPGGIDPSAFVGLSSSSDRKNERKTSQLCREVREALSLALGELDDATLDGTWVADVRADDPSHLRVIVVTDRTDADAVHEALQRAAGRLRAEVAAAITRKRVPLLSFEVHGGGEP